MNRRSFLQKSFAMALSLPMWARGMSLQASSRMPALFMAHGSPMNAIQDNTFTRTLTQIGQHLARPQAILMVRAHWETRGTWVQASAKPSTIHDFGGFPQPLFEVQYPAPGSPQWAAAVVQEALAHKVLIHATEEWGLDHGTWSVLKYLFPQADVPVFQLSLDVRLSPAQHWELASLLRPLRDRGVMIMGSGNIVHNLREADWKHQEGGPVYDWAQAFDAQLVQHIDSRNQTALTLQQPDPLFSRAHPSAEHYLPMLYVMGASHPTEAPHYVEEGFQHSSISMRSFLMQ